MARRIARQRGEAWLDDLRRQADLGDAQAIATLLSLAAEKPARPAAD